MTNQSRRPARTPQPGRPASASLVIRNRQRLQPFNVPLFKQIALILISELMPNSRFELGIYLVSPDEITRINETYLNHRGSTDVISFHYPDDDQVLRGEIFISVGDAIRQAAEFHTTWQAEIVRYAAHGLLHLKGYDDLTPSERRHMKRKENQLVNRIAKHFAVDQLARRSRRSDRPGSP